MSIYDNAGVVQIPSGYKAGTTDNLYSVLPANGNGDFNATRGSTATRVNKDGLIESVATNVPRLDYPLIDGVVQDCPTLLLEPQRTNALQYSEEFENAYWINNGITITANQIVSPDGTQTADLLTGVSGGFGVVVFSTWTSTNNCASCFAKKGSTNLFKIANVSASDRYVIFDLENGTVSEEATNWSGSIENFGNGWYRCTAISNNETGTFSLGVTAASESVYIWGAQLEAGSYATSYIPTSGSTATRSADVCNGSGTSAEFNDSEGVLFVESAALADDLTFRSISISDGTTSNRISLSYITTSNIASAYVNTTSGVAFSSSITINNIAENNKFVVKYKSGDYSFWINGFETSSGSSSNIFANGILNTLTFDKGNGGDDMYSNTKQLMTFKTALTDSELETLTSWDSFNAMAKGQLYTIE